MPAFKQMDPEVIRKALEGQEDILSPLVKKEEAFFKLLSCPVCGSQSHSSFVRASNPFTIGSPLPNKLLKCLQCNSEFEPFSGFVTRATDESG